MHHLPRRGRASPHRPDQKGRLGRNVLANIADETIKAIEHGSYPYQAHPEDPAENIDLRANVEKLKADTTYYGPDSVIASWTTPPAPSSTSRVTKIWAVEQSTLEASRWLVEKLALEPGDDSAAGIPGSRAHAVGVLNFASARRPGGGFLTGARAQEESLARSSTLYTSLMCPTGQQFYTYHHSITKGKNDGYYSHAMIYSPSVIIFRNDSGKWVRPFEVDFLTSPAVNAGVVREKRLRAIDRGEPLIYSETDMEAKICTTMKERMARLLYLFEIQGVKNLVLGSFGTGAFKNRVDMVVELWAELLLGEESRFGKSFDRVMFGVIDNETYVKFAQRFGADAG